MPYYLVQAAYTAESWATQLAAPADPRERLSALAQAAGGRLESFFYCFGEYDIVAIAEFPDNETAAAGALVAAAGGAAKAIRTTPLLTVDEGLSAMRKASRAVGGYEPPT
jgi:uncharacterized protein with GYD domain